MKKLLRIKPKPEVFAGMGVVNTSVEEVVVFPVHKKIELKCIFQSCEGFKELELIENNLKKHFGTHFEFNFNLNFSKKDISDEETCVIIESAVKELKRESAFAKAYFSLYEYEIHNNILYFKLESQLGIQKLQANKFDEKLEITISKLISKKIQVKFINGDFSEEVKKVEEKSLAIQEEKLIKQEILVK